MVALRKGQQCLTLRIVLVGATGLIGGKVMEARRARRCAPLAIARREAPCRRHQDGLFVATLQNGARSSKRSSQGDDLRARHHVEEVGRERGGVRAVDQDLVLSVAETAR